MAGGIPSGFQIGQAVTPAQAAANYKAKASAAGSWWATKYLMAKTDPFNAAAAAADTWLANINNAGTAGFKAGLSRVNRTAVAQLVSTQGPSLYNAGITNKGATKYASAAAGLIPALQNIAANLPPRGNLDQNIARAAAQARGAAALRGKYRAGSSGS